MALRKRRAEDTPEGAFALEVAMYAKRVPGVRKVAKADDFALRVTSDDGDDMTLYLGTIFAQTRELDAAARRVAVEQFVRAIPVRHESPEGWDDARRRIMPAVRPISWATSVPGDNQPVRRPLAPFVVEMVAVDHEHSMAIASAREFDHWGIDPDEAFRLASENLLDAGMPVMRSGIDGVVEVIGPDGYASSWLAAPAALLELSRELHGDPLAVAPHRDHLYVVGDEDTAAVVALLDVVIDEYRAAPRQVSPVLYRLHDHAIEPWRPAADHPAAVRVHNSRQLLAGVEYEQQKRRLQDLLLGAGEDVFVASLLLAGPDGGRINSHVAWVEDVTAGLLPPADLVGMVSGDDRFVVPWDEVLRVAGRWIRPEPGLDPPRWRVSGWPPPDVVEQLRAEAQR